MWVGRGQFVDLLHFMRPWRKVKREGIYLSAYSQISSSLVSRRICVSSKKRLLASSCLSVCLSFRLSAFINSAPTGWIFVETFMKICRGIQIRLTSDKNIGQFTWRFKRVYIVDRARQQLKRETLLHFYSNTQQFYVVDSDIWIPNREHIFAFW